MSESTVALESINNIEPVFETDKLTENDLVKKNFDADIQQLMGIIITIPKYY